MQSAPSPVKLSYGDLVRLPDDGKRHELIDGVHIVTPSPSTAHQRVAGNLFFLIRLHLESHPIGTVFMAPLDVVFSEFDVVEPDLLFVSHARAGILTETHVHGSPDLVVEVTSPRTARRDEGIKLALYDRFEIEESWVIDPASERFRVYRRRDGRLARFDELSAPACGVLTTPLLPGMRLPVARVFEP